MRLRTRERRRIRKSLRLCGFAITSYLLSCRLYRACASRARLRNGCLCLCTARAAGWRALAPQPVRPADDDLVVALDLDRDAGGRIENDRMREAELKRQFRTLHRRAVTDSLYLE